MRSTNPRSRPAVVARCIIAAVVLAAFQVLVETVALAWLYRGLLLPPREFFPQQCYDAFVKVYGWLAPLLGLPHLLDSFVGRGLLPKLAIGAPLLAMAVPVALLVGLAAGLLACLVRPRLSLRGALAALAAGELILHTATWLTTVYIPVEPTLRELARNFARNFLFDGTALALLVTATAAGASFAVAARDHLGRAVVAAAAAAVLAASGGLVAPATPASAAREQHSQAAGKPLAEGYNVILISIDSLRADHLGAYGYKRNTSPAIDRLAREGVLFRHASSTTAWTLPAHMSMLTGRSLLGHGVVSDDRSLTPDVPTLAESMRAAGYTTGAIVSAPYLEKRFGFDRGFDEYDDQTIRFESHGSSYRGVTAPRLQKAAAAWLERHRGERFFLFLHYWDVHYDYDPGPPYERMFDPDYRGTITGRNFYFNPAINPHMDPRDLQHIIALYDGEIRLVDDHIAKLRATLERLGLASRTAILLTADHGDEFFEHGHKGHHRSLYEEIVRVPMILYVPGRRPTRREVSSEVSLIDVAPTLADLVGAPPLAGAEGRSLVPLAFGSEPERPRLTFAELYRKKALNVQVSVRNGPEKLIHHFNRRLVEVYDTSADPGEHRPLPSDRGFAVARMDDLAEWLNRQWKVFAGRIRSQGGVRELVMDDEMRDKLRSLGYIQ
ncbi:MAG: hypothetical protein D6815_12545 [Candidatus Dadabacteria bacterium]|nr:MAG: hypothetical protein D6815_12545 [Candidatus Dadabacteria bacterium]